MESALSKYQQNKQEMMTPILPADVNGPPVSNISSLGNHFSAAANATVQAVPAPPPQSPMDMNAKQELAASGNAVGQTLQDNTQSIRVQMPQSPAGYLANSTMKMGMELGSELMNLFGSKKPETPENDLEINAPRPQHTMAMRPSTGGMFGA